MNKAGRKEIDINTNTCYISFQRTREDALKLYKQCKKSPHTACVEIAGKRAKTWRLYEDLRIKNILRHNITVDPKEYPWVVAWENRLL